MNSLGKKMYKLKSMSILCFQFMKSADKPARKTLSNMHNCILINT
jgi:hypothetical protein